MANNLGRDLESGEIVILEADILLDEYNTMEFRRVRALGGFGMYQVTAGYMLSCEHPLDGESARYGGDMLDREATAAYQSEFGRFGERDPRNATDAKPYVPREEAA